MSQRAAADATKTCNCNCPGEDPVSNFDFGCTVSGNTTVTSSPSIYYDYPKWKSCVLNPVVYWYNCYDNSWTKLGPTDPYIINKSPQYGAQFPIIGLFYAAGAAAFGSYPLDLGINGVLIYDVCEKGKVLPVEKGQTHGFKWGPTLLQGNGWIQDQ